jgi:hypothetical protein
MLTGNVRPTTLNGVKSLAGDLRKQQNIKHSSALDIAARAANCSNYRNAQKILPVRGPSAERPYVLLTIYWCNKDKRYEIGRDTLRIELARPIFETCSKTLLKRVRGFENLRMVADDHFICDYVAHNQDYARKRLATAERSLRFMEETGLRPSLDYRMGYPAKSLENSLPGSDHATDWIDPVTGQVIVVDEPYSGVPDDNERAAWAKRHNWRIKKTSWPGMYYPYNCDLYVTTDGTTGYDLDALVTKINAMPVPWLVQDWPGDSVASWETFLSPMAKTPQDARRARCRGTIYPAASATTVPYSYAMGASRRRPAGTLGADGHIEAGEIIRALLASSGLHNGVYNRMNSLRSTLESWMFCEIDDKHFDDPNPESFDTYYGDIMRDNPYRQIAGTKAGILILLGMLKNKLTDSYPNCAPLRKQLRHVESSIALTQKMKAT